MAGERGCAHDRRPSSLLGPIMRTAAVACLLAGSLFVDAASAQIVEGVLRAVPGVLGGQKDKEKPEQDQSTLGRNLILGTGAIAVGTVAAGAVAQNTQVAVRQRGTLQGDQALRAIRSYMIGAAATAGVRSVVQFQVGGLMRNEPALEPAGRGVLADLGFGPAVAAALPNTRHGEVRLPASASKLTWAELLNRCREVRTRSMALADAYQWVGFSPFNFALLRRLPWSEFRPPAGLTRNSRAFVDFRGMFPREDAYEQSSTTGAYVREHPLGHPDQPGEAHHDCPHVHAYTPAKGEIIRPYRPAMP
jgi:hypothetical protein